MVAPPGTAAPLGRRLDAADLIAMTLSQAELGPAYQTWPFDWVFGGLEDNEERARDKSEDPAKERADLERFGRLVAYQQMYSPSPSPSQRIWTIVHVFRDPAGTAGYLAAKVDELKSRRTDFPVGSIGDQALGFHYKIADGRNAWRVYVRRGAILAGVGLNGTAADDASQELIALARKLDDRVDRGLRGDLRAYTGAPGGEVSAEQLRLMAVPQADLGVDYAKFDLAFDTAGYQDNEERANTWSPDRDKGLAAFHQAGRVTGYVAAYSSEFAPRGASPIEGYVHTGVHLLRDADAARQFLLYEGAQEKDLAGRGRIDSVRELGLSVGEEAIAVRRAGTPGDIWRVIFRRGRIVGEAFIRRENDHDDRQTELARLAQTLDDRIQRVLRGDLKP